VRRVSYQKLGLQGALGNQLWEIAGTYGIARSLDALPAFPEDWFYRPFFSIPDDYFVENFHECDDLGDDYLQDMSHWSDNPAAVLGMFEMSEVAEEMIDERYGNSGADLVGKTCIHVRRGNNVTPQYASHHPVLSLDYYEQAMDIAGGPFRVISDSPEWCRKQSLFKDCEFGVGPPAGVDIMELTKYGPLGNVEAIIDLNSMRYAKRIIMSNSSFSWWGAYLRMESYDPIPNQVIYPKAWYGEPLAHINTSVMFNRYWADQWRAL
jgi:Glycosyl transferase family 11